MKFHAIMGKMNPMNMDSLASLARETFPGIPFTSRVDYSRRVTCHGSSMLMNPEQLAEAASCIGEDDRFIPKELRLTPNDVWVVGEYENTKPAKEAMIDILCRTDGENDDFTVIRTVPINHRPVGVFFKPY